MWAQGHRRRQVYEASEVNVRTRLDPPLARDISSAFFHARGSLVRDQQSEPEAANET